MESNMGYSSDDSLDNNNEELEGKRKTPQELSIMVLDVLHEQATAVRSPDV